MKDKNNQIIEGNPDTIKTVNDVWKFSKNMWSQDPTWYLVETSQNSEKKKFYFILKIKKIGLLLQNRWAISKLKNLIY